VDPDPNSDPDPAIFVTDPQDANKKLIEKKVFCLLLFEGTFRSFFKDKKSIRSHKAVGIKVVYVVNFMYMNFRAHPFQASTGTIYFYIFIMYVGKRILHTVLANHLPPPSGT
jgi:hypothetical protein